MAYALTAVIASVCVIDACVIGHWTWNTNITPLKDKKTSYAIVQAVAFIIAFVLVVLCWYLFTHQALPQWLTGIGSRPIKRIHIEYEVTNSDELRASVQNKEELKQFIGGE